MWHSKLHSCRVQGRQESAVGLVDGRIIARMMGAAIAVPAPVSTREPVKSLPAGRCSGLEGSAWIALTWRHQLGWGGAGYVLDFGDAKSVLVSLSGSRSVMLRIMGGTPNQT